MPDDLKRFDQELELAERGTARLVQAALNTPSPSRDAEAESRRQLEQLMQEAALSPKVLREAVRVQPRRSWWQKLLGKD